MSASLQQGQGNQQWLVRSVENQISGPFTLQQIREMIEHGKIRLGDEVCNANTYWFYLHENEEVRTQLGIEIPQRLYTKRMDEATETQTDATGLDRTDPEIGVTRMATASVVRAEPEPPELDSSLEDLGENTAVMSNRAFRDYRHKKPSSSPGPVRVDHVNTSGVASHAASHATPHVAPHAPVPRRIIVERSRIFKILAYVLMIGAVLLIFAVLKILQQQPS